MTYSTPPTRSVSAAFEAHARSQRRHRPAAGPRVSQESRTYSAAIDEVLRQTFG